MRSLAIARAALRREWGVQRDTLLKLAAVTPILAGIVSVALLWHGQKGRDTVSAAALCTLLLGYAGICPGLIASEIERGSFKFLARTPRALRAAFGAKLLVLLVLPAVIAMLGALCAIGIRSAMVAEPATAFFGPAQGFALIALLVALWTLPCGVVLRSSLVLPVGLLIGSALLLWPLLRVQRPSPSEMILAACACCAAGVLSAYLGLIRGRARGCSSMRTTTWALAPIVPLLLGTFAWVENSAARERMTPVALHSYLSDAYLSADGRTLYLMEIRKGTDWYRSVVFDLSSRRVVSEEDRSSFQTLGIFDTSSIHSGHFGRHALLARWSHGAEAYEIFRTNDGERCGSIAHSGFPGRYEIGHELEAWMRETKRGTSPWRDRGGRTLWMQSDRWERGAESGERFEPEPEPGAWNLAAAGRTLFLLEQGDALGRKRFKAHVSTVPRSHGDLVVTLQLSGLVHQPAQEAWGSEERNESAGIIREAAIVLARTSDSPSPNGVTLELEDWQSGERRPVDVRGMSAASIEGLMHAGRWRTPARIGTHELLVFVFGQDGGARLAVLDTASASLHVAEAFLATPGDEPPYAVGSTKYGSVLIVDRRCLVEFDLYGRRCVKLYEVPEA